MATIVAVAVVVDRRVRRHHFVKQLAELITIVAVSTTDVQLLWLLLLLLLVLLLFSNFGNQRFDRVRR